MLIRLLAISASAALFAGAAYAQTTTATGAAQAGPAAVTDTTSVSPSNPAATAPVDTTGYNSSASANAAAPAIDAPAAVDTTVVSNGPVPDTAANRAKYGKPDSHAGKRTSPAGN